MFEFDYAQGMFSVELRFPITCKKLLMLDIVSHICESLTYKSIKNVENSYFVERKIKGNIEYVLQTQGINMYEAFKYHKVFDLNRIETNDI